MLHGLLTSKSKIQIFLNETFNAFPKSFLFLILILPIERRASFPISIQLFKVIILSSFLFLNKNNLKVVLEQLSRNTTFWFLAILYFTFHMMSLFQSIDPTFSMNFVLYLLVLILSLILFNVMIKKGGVEAFCSVLALMGLMPCVLGLLQYILVSFNIVIPFFDFLLPHEMTTIGRLYWEDLHSIKVGVRITSVFYHSNGFGHFLILLVPMVIYKYTQSDTKLLKFFWASIGFLYCNCVFLTQSRAAIVLLFVLLILLSLHFQNKQSAAIFIGFFLITSIIFYMIFPEVLTKSFERFIESGLSFRDLLWEASLNILDKYWFTGVGQGNSGRIIYELFGSLSRNLFEKITLKHMFFGEIDFIPLTPHQFYFTQWIELGFFGLLAALFFLSYIYIRSFLMYCVKNTKNHFLYVCCFCTLFIELPNSLVSSYSFFEISSVPLYAYIALILSHESIED